jgi:glutamate-1-semialdehyde 2,1-aminomutase
MAWTNQRNHQLVERARRVILGEMYGHQSTAILPAAFPQFFSRAEGARLWDANGNEYIDYICAFGPNLLVGLSASRRGHRGGRAAPARRLHDGAL